jgi:hypothetical protein
MKTRRRAEILFAAVAAALFCASGGGESYGGTIGNCKPIGVVSVDTHGSNTQRVIIDTKGNLLPSRCGYVAVTLPSVLFLR